MHLKRERERERTNKQTESTILNQSTAIKLDIELVSIDREGVELSALIPETSFSSTDFGSLSWI